MTNNPPTEPTPDAPTGASDMPEPQAAPNVQPTEVFPAPDYAAQAPYAAPPAPGYGQPVAPQGYAPAPTLPDTRSKKIAWVALSLSIVGLLLSLFGFIPIAWVGFALVLVGGFLLLAALVFSIIGLAGKRNGGKPISIIALVISVVGGFIGTFALIVAIVFTGLSTADRNVDLTPDPVPSPTSEVDGGTTGDGSTDGTDAATTEAQAAFLAEVRPKVTEIMLQIDPSMTAEQVNATFTDASLITIGQALLATGEAGIDPFVDQTLAGAGDVVDADQLRTLFQTIYDAAKAHLK